MIYFHEKPPKTVSIKKCRLFFTNFDGCGPQGQAWSWPCTWLLPWPKGLRYRSGPTGLTWAMMKTDGRQILPQIHSQTSFQVLQLTFRYIWPVKKLRNKRSVGRGLAFVWCHALGLGHTSLTEGREMVEHH